MYFIKRNVDFKIFNSFIRLYSIASKNHYEVLNLRRNCSDKEIKEAFIQMSKEYHPDKNKDARAQDKFVRIVEAYNVLSKPSSRAQYDSITTVASSSDKSTSYVYRTHVPYNLRKNPNYSYYNQQTKTHTAKENTDAYYGFTGIKKLPNFYIIMMCFGIASIGVFLQLYVIRNLYVAHKQQSLERSKHLAEELDKVRSAARDNGNELQTRILLDKIVSAANPTVATASLGQALANEKKDASETMLTEFGISDAHDDWTTYSKSPHHETWDYDERMSFHNGKRGL
ncbi:hypothetical protein K1T71_008187 [Dendrolimus kikuchii]|uniref:Uncharacterized protein n=1 Tax=Dendrolimus kikuchii TaxID=765133 RepID=A0ACC1CWI4_9NEOP|nr:hypothetical protein K1T71_008187 [Dendrolimus kikuchii]